jgi:hypothetical protein
MRYFLKTFLYAIFLKYFLSLNSDISQKKSEFVVFFSEFNLKH